MYLSYYFPILECNTSFYLLGYLGFLKRINSFWIRKLLLIAPPTNVSGLIFVVKITFKRNYELLLHVYCHALGIYKLHFVQLHWFHCICDWNCWNQFNIMNPHLFNPTFTWVVKPYLLFFSVEDTANCWWIIMINSLAYLFTLPKTFSFYPIKIFSVIISVISLIFLKKKYFIWKAG